MITFGSRGSDLARCQSRMVADALTAATGEEVRIEIIETRGDVILDKPLPMIGGKGLFTEELEQALREGRIDIAVHSMKDLPVRDPDGLTIGAVFGRRSPNDVLIYDPTWADATNNEVPLRTGCRVGTSSYRRRAALERVRPDLMFADIRGNVPTRVDKVRRGDYGAVVLAAAGLDRLQLPIDGLLRKDLAVSWSTPAPAQGALAVQCRADDPRVRAALAKLHDEEAALCAHAERDVLERLGGGCSMPLGVLVTREDATMRLQAAFYTNPEHGPTKAAGLFANLRGEDPMALAAQVASDWQPLASEPLRGRDVILLRPDGNGGDFEAAFAVAGARVSNIALTAVRPLPDVTINAGQIVNKKLAFTSVRAVELFCAIAECVQGIDLRGVPVFAGGPVTADAARDHGMVPATPAAGCGGALLAQHIANADVPTGGVLFPCAIDRHPDLEAGLQAAGVAVSPLPLYRTEQLPDVELPPLDDAILVFTSPSAVRAYASRTRAPARHLAIGPSTAAAMADVDLRCDGTAAEPTAMALIQTCLELSNA